MDTQIDKDEQKTMIFNQIDEVRKIIFKNQIMERYYQRRTIKNPNLQSQLGNIQKSLKDDKEYLAFLQEILKEY